MDLAPVHVIWLIIVLTCTAQSAEGDKKRRTIRFAGSSTVFPVVSSWAEQYTDQYDFHIHGGGSSTGARQLCLPRNDSQHVEIGGMSRQWKPSEAIELDDGYTWECVDSKMRVTQLVICIDGIAVVVAKDGVAHRCLQKIGLGGLTVAQLRWMFTDRSDAELTQHGLNMKSAVPNNNGNGLKEWSDLSPECPEMPINIYGPGNHSGTHDFFGKAVLCANCFPHIENFPCCSDATAQRFERSDIQTFAELVETERMRNCYVYSENDTKIVEWVQRDTSGVGYVGLAHYESLNTQLYAVRVASDEARGVTDTHDALIWPTSESIVDGSYSILSRNLYMYVDNGAWPVVRPFVDFAFSEAGQKVAANVGCVPINIALRAKMLQRIAEMGNKKANYIATSSTTSQAYQIRHYITDEASNDPTNPNPGDLHSTLSLDAVVVSLASLLLCVLIMIGACVYPHCHQIKQTSRNARQDFSSDDHSITAVEAATLSLLPALCDAIASLDSEMRIIHPCPKLAIMLHEPPDSIEGKLFTSFLTAEDVERFANFINHIAQEQDDGICPTLNVHFNSAEGAPIGVQLFGRSFQDVSQEIRHVIGICEQTQHKPTCVGISSTTGSPCDYDGHEKHVDARYNSMAGGTSLISSRLADSSIEVSFEGLTQHFPIVDCSEDFANIINCKPLGQSMLDWIWSGEEAVRFQRWISYHVNCFLNEQQPVAESPTFKLSLRVSSDKGQDSRYSSICAIDVQVVPVEDFTEDLVSDSSEGITLVRARLTCGHWVTSNGIMFQLESVKTSKKATI